MVLRVLAVQPCVEPVQTNQVYWQRKSDNDLISSCTPPRTMHWNGQARAQAID